MACRPSCCCCWRFIPVVPGLGSCGADPPCAIKAKGCASSSVNTNASIRVEKLRDCINILKKLGLRSALGNYGRYGTKLDAAGNYRRCMGLLLRSPLLRYSRRWFHFEPLSLFDQCHQC